MRYLSILTAVLGLTLAAVVPSMAQTQFSTDALVTACATGDADACNSALDSFIAELDAANLEDSVFDQILSDAVVALAELTNVSGANTPAAILAANAVNARLSGAVSRLAARVTNVEQRSRILQIADAVAAGSTDFQTASITNPSPN